MRQPHTHIHPKHGAQPVFEDVHIELVVEHLLAELEREIVEVHGARRAVSELRKVGECAAQLQRRRVCGRQRGLVAELRGKVFEGLKT